MGEIKKSIFLFGAGAVLDWGGPLTLCNKPGYTVIPEHGTGEIYNRPCCLTHLLLHIGFRDASGVTITQKIYDFLKKNKSESDVNFEGILNIIEDLYTYWSARASKEVSNLLGALDLDEELAGLHYFNVIQHEYDRYYTLEVPGFTLYGVNMVSKEIDPHVKYYEILLNELLSGIIGHVSKYSFASNKIRSIDDPVNGEINKSFRDFIKGFWDSDKLLRVYTLNYDDIFKQLIEDEGKKVFDGFLDAADIAGFDRETDLKKIVFDANAICHYNLHGSAFWKVEELNKSQLPGYQYAKSIPGIVNESAASIEIEKGKKVLLSNIISGFQKVQKTAVSPFRQMFSALDRDLLDANELYLVGYSFGDEHINDIIRNAKRCNERLRVILVNPRFDDVRFALDFLSNWGEPRLGVYENKGDNIVISKQFQILAFQYKFGNFLNAFNRHAINKLWN